MKLITGGKSHTSIDKIQMDSVHSSIVVQKAGIGNHSYNGC